MKRLSFTLGICLLSAGLGILLSMFLPDSLLICIQSVLLIIAGFLFLCSK